MRKFIVASAACLVGLALSGCFYQNMSPATKLRDAIEANNEGARWGRMDIAMERVAPEYARDFARRRTAWGDDIQLADLDILSVNMDSEEDSAIVIVAFGWYGYSTMTLHRTVVRQKWRSGGSGFVVFEEEVIDGEEELLEPPYDDEDEEEEAEEAAASRDDDDADDDDANDDADDDDHEDQDDHDEAIASETSGGEAEWVTEDGQPSGDSPALARAD